MTQSLPQTPVSPSPSYSLADWRGGTLSLAEEFDYAITDIEGTVPVELQGTLFRNGPGLLDIGGVPLKHPFDGDGMVCAFRFDRGQVHFRNRYVRTPGYLAEQAADRILYRGVFGTQKPGGWLANAFDLRLKSIANTQVLYWGGKLLALWEADRPYRLDPHSLATLGEESFDQVLAPGTAFAAHAKVVPAAGSRPTRLVSFGLKPGLSTALTIYELNEQGQVVQQQQRSLPGFAFIHDFAVTPNYCIFFQNPVQFNPLPFLLGLRGPGECIQFQPHQPTRIWIVPRDGQGEMLCLNTDACFVFHQVNAWEQSGQIGLDSICYDRFPSLDPQQDYRQVDFAALPPGQLWRFELDLASKTVQRHCLKTRCCEFPTLHPAKVGQDYRYLYLAIAAAAEGNAPLQGLMKIDLQTGAEQIWSAAPQGFMGEPVFVPKPTGEKSFPEHWEEDGWILALVYDAHHHRSDLVILEAAHLQAGPIARLHLKHHIPYGLHGSFVDQVFSPSP